MGKDMKRPEPPRWAIRFFRWYCNDHLLEAVLGDMMELYHRRYHRVGKTRANLLFVLNVILFCQPFAFERKSRSAPKLHYAMFQNYITVIWRSMVRQKMYAIIKISGLALGLAASFLIFLFLRQELSYDKEYVNGNRLYRLYSDFQGPQPGKGTAFPASIASILESDFPEVEKAARLIPYNWFNAGNNLFRRDDEPENTYEERFAYADPELLEILEIPMIYGNAAKALLEPNSIVISQREAEKYFPGEDPVGKIVILNNDSKNPYTIGGVMENFPSTSHLQFDFLLTLSGKEFWPGEQTSWCCWNYNPYLLVKPGVDVEQFEKKLASIKEYFISYLRENKNQSLGDFQKYFSLHLQPVKDIYLKSDGIDDPFRHSDMKYIWLFGGVAFFIVLLACINFINLSTARSANRAKEVGLRKVVGSERSYLVRQFMTESLMYSLIAFVLGIVLVSVTLPYFNAVTDRNLSIPWTAWWLFPMLLSSVLIIGLVAGIYPAFYLSSFKPISVLKGTMSRGSRSSAMRSSLVIFQFTTSIVLIIGTFIIYRQMNFILNTKIGFDKEQVIMIQGANTLDRQQTSFKNELLQLPDVQNVTISDYLPVTGTTRDFNTFWREGKSQEEKGISAQRWRVDDDYISTLGMKLLEGRNFMEEMASDSQAIIINQAMVRELGLKHPVGERIMNWSAYTVIGVVEDFNFESMKGKIEPLCLVRGNGGSIVAVKIKSGNMHEIIQEVTTTWKKFMPNQPIRYTFLDERYARMYDDVQRTGSIFAGFAILAVFIACLGLFALSAFMVEQRNKEISIRLVLGASIRNIFQLLTGNFVKLVLISFCIATPLAWLMMKQWLEDYAYRIPITWDVFVLAGLVAILIALLTISYQSVRAALVNPSATLRSE